MNYIPDTILYTDLYAAYSLRLLRVGYTGHCITVSPTATGTDYDIDFDDDGNLDTDALQTLINDNSWGDVFVKTWWNQAYDSVSNTAVPQSIVLHTDHKFAKIAKSGVIITNGLGMPAVLFEMVGGVSSIMSESGSSSSNGSDWMALNIHRQCGIYAVNSLVSSATGTNTAGISFMAQRAANEINYSPCIEIYNNAADKYHTFQIKLSNNTYHELFNLCPLNTTKVNLISARLRTPSGVNMKIEKNANYEASVTSTYAHEVVSTGQYNTYHNFWLNGNYGAYYSEVIILKKDVDNSEDKVLKENIMDYWHMAGSIVKALALKCSHLQDKVTVESSNPTDFTVSAFSNGTFTESIEIEANTATLGCNVYVKFNPATTGSKTGTIGFSSEGATPLSITVTGTVTA